MLESLSTKPHERLLAAVGVVLILLIAAVLWWHPFSNLREGRSVALNGATSTTWYFVDDATIGPDTAAHDDAVLGKDGMRASASGVGELHLMVSTGTNAPVDLGPGRPLRFLADGKLLAATPFGLWRVNVSDDALEQVIGQLGSSTPLAAMNEEGTLVALENPTTRLIHIYRFDREKNAATYLGAADATPLVRVTEEQNKQVVMLVQGTTTAPATGEQKDAIIRGVLAYMRMDARPVAVGFAKDTLILKTRSGEFFSFAITGDTIGQPVPLRITSAK